MLAEAFEKHAEAQDTERFMVNAIRTGDEGVGDLGATGIPAPNFRMPADLRLGPVRFQVADLEQSLTFYRKVLGLRAIDGSDLVGDADAGDSTRRTTLGAGGEPLIELIERRGARPVVPHSRLGLYHVAILLPDRQHLGRFIRHAADRGVRLGTADHLVSEAVYLNDPDGLGLEVYADRPRSTWSRRGGELRTSAGGRSFGTVLIGLSSAGARGGAFLQDRSPAKDPTRSMVPGWRCIAVPITCEYRPIRSMWATSSSVRVTCRGRRRPTARASDTCTCT